MLEVDSSGVKKATDNLNAFSKAAKDSEKQAVTFDDVMNQFNLNLIATSAGVVGLVKAFKGLVTGLKQVASLSVQNYSSFESMQKGLETFFQSAEKGKSKFEELRKLSNQTTFGVDELADSFTQLANVGMAVDTINEKLMMLGDLSGGNKMKFAELVSVYSKIQSTGKAGSMQLQQIATKGIPIYDMLKKIGVEGTATANDVTKAFQEMTKEGGQFYNAMSNINDTIEGKEGFISDYFKEMTVNFAEASGIAEAYKGILDTVREAIGAVSDWLLKINENPVSKAIFQGTLAASLTLVGTLLAVTIVSALKKVGVELKKRISELTVIQALSGPAGWKNLAVAGIVAATAGITVLTKELIEAKSKADGLANSLPKGSGASGYSDDKGFTEHTYSSIKELEHQTSLHSTYLEEYKELENEIRNLQQQAMKSFSLTEIETLNKYIAEKQEESEILEDKIVKSDKRIEELKRAAKGEQFDKDAKQFKKDILDMFDETSYGKALSQIQEFEKELNNLNAQYDVFKITMDADSMKKAEAVINEWKEKVSDMKIKIAVDSQSDWQKVLSKNFGFSDKDIANLMNSGFTGKAAGDLWKEKIGKRNSAEDTVLKKLGYTRSSDTEKNNAVDLYNTLKDLVFSIAKDENYQVTEKDTIFESLVPQIKEAANALERFGLAVDESGDIVEKQLQSFGFSLEDYAEKLKKAGLSDVQNGKTKYDGAQLKIDSLRSQYESVTETGDKEAIGNILKEFASAVTASGEGFAQMKNGYASYAGGAALSAAGNALQGTDAGNFLQGMSMGGPIVGLINMLIGAIGNVLQSCEGFSDAFNVVTNIFKMAKPLFQTLIDIINDLNQGVMTAFKPLMGILNAFGIVLKAISNVLNPILNLLVSGFGLFEWLGDLMEEWGLVTEETTEKQAVDLTDAYKSLLEAMKANEEEYEKRKKELNSADYASKVTGVHDMILTPQGNFSTDPDDYIIATKNPAGLNGGNGTAVIQLQPIINNTMADTAKVETRTEYGDNGMMNLIVKISRKVAQDYADGTNGWDNAVSSRAYRQNGRNLAM